MLSTTLVKASNLFNDAKFDQIDRAKKLMESGYIPLYAKNTKTMTWYYAITDGEPVFGETSVMKKVNKDTARSIFELLNVEPDL